MNLYEELQQRYLSGSLPWDSPEPPPEVIALADRLEPGRALDLGCGYGRASIHLAQKGWLADGVDFVPQAISEAKTRAKTAAVSESIHFHVASVADLDFLEGSYDLALDVGCLHALSTEESVRYRDGLRRLLKPGAIFLLFVRLGQADSDREDGPPALKESAILSLFAEGFVLQKVEHGETQVGDADSWKSAWFWFERREP